MAFTYYFLSTQNHYFSRNFLQLRETSLDNDRCQSQYEALYKQFMASGAQKEEPSPTQAVKKTSPSSSAKPQQVRQLQMPAVAAGGEPAAAVVAASNSLGLSSSTQAAGAVVEQPAPVPANEVVPAHVQSGHVVSQKNIINSWHLKNVRVFNVQT